MTTTPTPSTGAWLRRRFGVAELRPHQEDVVTALLDGRRVLYVAPTGHGKSLCYQALAAHPARSGLVLVFTPLKALMHEQVERARGLRLRADFINSDLAPVEQDAVYERAEAGALDLLFIAPERLGTDSWQHRVTNLEIKGIVIDEAHCISQWGHDFRPWYRRLVRAVLGVGVRTPVLATTATAPPVVIDDIQGQIAPDSQAVDVFRVPSHRPEIALRVIDAADATEGLAHLLDQVRARPGQPGIVYALTQKSAMIAAHCLDAAGIAAKFFHANLNSEERAERMSQWRDGDFHVLCATSALGMGLDRQDLRWVIHLGLPTSLLEYVQQIGRAGRDGSDADATAIVTPEDRRTQEALVHQSAPPLNDVCAVAEHLSRARGSLPRRAIIEALDLPEARTQRILDDLVDLGHVQRRGRDPYEYAWDPSADVQDLAIDRSGALHRGRLLQESRGYPAAAACRAVALAAAMGDDPLPAPCGRCDRCRPPPRSRPPTEDVVAALSTLRPQLPGRPAKNLHAGLALSFYGVGLGRDVARAKRAGAPMPAAVRDASLEVLRSHPHYRGVDFDAIVAMPPTESPEVVVGDLARWLADQLGCAAYTLVKQRPTDPQKRWRSKLKKQANVADAFARPPGLRARRILLLDDVADTGHSIKAAAAALAPAAVYPLAFAKTVHQDDT